MIALRFLLPAFVVAGLAVLLGACVAEPSVEPSAGSVTQDSGAAESTTLHFVDVAGAVGLDAFRQVSGDAEKLYLPASTGAGVGLFDYDADGDLDVFLVNGSRMAGFAAGKEPTNRLFRNQESGAAFVDVTAEVGLLSGGSWGQGLAVADVDGNGLLDIYVTNYESNALYLNRRDAGGAHRFEEVAAEVGVATAAWSTGAAFFDYDRDGDLDLYVANFVRYDEVLAEYEGREWLTHTWKGLQVAAGPQGMPAASDQLYRNELTESGVLRFTEVTEEMGIAAAVASYGFQPSIGDYDGDGWLDLFVANDSMPNFLWHNESGGGFIETAFLTGVAVDRSGNKQACMGVAFDDLDGDGWLDLFVTNFADDLNTLYVGDSTGFFYDDTQAVGLVGSRTNRNLGWGTFFFDADNDGDLDLFVANGHVYPAVDQLPGEESYAQADELYERQADGRYREVSAQSGPGLQVVKVGRGAAFGDLDNDGDLDIVVNNFDDTPTVLRNESSSNGHWIRVLLRGRSPNLAAIGARVSVQAGGRQWSRYVRSSDSFLSHHDLRLHFGLGPIDEVDRIVVDWPDGTSEEFEPGEVDRLLLLQMGTGTEHKP